MTDQTAVEVSACRSCGAPIYWAETKAGKRCPYDLDGDQPTDRSHFKTCNAPQYWSKKRSGGHRE